MGELIELLIGKFPEFDPEWSDLAQGAWLTAFQRMLGMAQPAPVAPLANPPAPNVAAFLVEGPAEPRPAPMPNHNGASAHELPAAILPARAPAVARSATYRPTGERSPRLTSEQIERVMDAAVNTRLSARELAEEMGVAESAVSKHMTAARKSSGTPHPNKRYVITPELEATLRRMVATGTNAAEATRALGGEISYWTVSKLLTQYRKEAGKETPAPFLLPNGSDAGDLYEGDAGYRE